MHVSNNSYLYIYVNNIEGDVFGMWFGISENMDGGYRMEEEEECPGLKLSSPEWPMS